MVRQIIVLRYGHRLIRDARVTSHVCLTARALGANAIVLCGDQDEKLKEEIKAFVKKWGGRFKVFLNPSWKNALEEYSGRGFVSVHLTMYGKPLQKKLKQLKREKKILLIVGSRKVEREVYEKADFNISVTTQPHSEVAALAIALHELFEGKELEKKFPKAKVKVVPQAKGKKVKIKKWF